MRRVLLLWVLILVGCSPDSPRLAEMPDFTHPLGDHLVIDVPMRDGVTLATDVWLPEGQGPWPTLLIRTPYSRDGFPMYMRRMGKMWARYGYATVIQDVRGRFDSGGEWQPMVFEADDGEDTGLWVLNQPWCNGKLGLLGTSYLTITSWNVAARLGDKVSSMVLTVGSTDSYSLTYQGGMLALDVVGSWMLGMSNSTFSLRAPKKFNKAANHLPLIEADDVTVGPVPFVDDMLSHPSRDGRWSTMDLRAVPAHTRAPVMMLTGWYDIFLGQQLKDFQNLQNQQQSRLVVGPWTHLGGMIEKQELDYPGAEDVRPYLAEILTWFEVTLKGAPRPEAWAKVSTYTIGENRWVTSPAWPPAEAHPKRLYLSSEEKTGACVGGLLRDEPAPSAIDTFHYDPQNPVPTIGGALLGWVLGATDNPGGAHDQSPLCSRPDILSYLTPVLTRPLTLAGPMSIQLDVASTAPDTAFTAKLVDVAGEHTMINIQEGIMSLAYRDSDTHPVSTPPGTRVTLKIDLAQTHWTLPAGHQLRVDISSSSFPRYHRHPNVFGDFATIKGTVPADQQVFLGGEASFVEITTLP